MFFVNRPFPPVLEVGFEAEPCCFESTVRIHVKITDSRSDKLQCLYQDMSLRSANIHVEEKVQVYVPTTDLSLYQKSMKYSSTLSPSTRRWVEGKVQESLHHEGRPN